MLDVNVGLPEIDEAAMMEEVVRELQSIIDLPLQIDTSNIPVSYTHLDAYKRQGFQECRSAYDGGGNSS